MHSKVSGWLNRSIEEVAMQKHFDVGPKKIEPLVHYGKKGKLNNRHIIQSRILTTASHDLSVIRVRILVYIVLCVQAELEGEKLDKNFSISENLFGYVNISISVSFPMHGEKDENYAQVRKAFRNFQGRTVEYEDGNEWEIINPIIKSRLNRCKGTVEFRVKRDFFDVLFDFTKGYMRYELVTMMSLNGKYAQRFYPMVSG